MILVCSLTFSLVFGILYYIWIQRAKAFAHINKAPYWPIVGSIFHARTDPHEFYKQLIEFATQNNYLYVGWILYTPILFAGTTDYVEFVLSSREHLTKSFFYRFLNSWLGTGLLTSDGEKWRKRRKLITPSFHFSILNQFELIFFKKVSILVSKFKTLAEKGDPFDVQVPISLATLDVICESAMGVDINAQSETQSEYVAAVNFAISEQQTRQKLPWLHPEITYPYTPNGRRYFKNLKILQDFTTKVINDKVKNRKNNSKDVDGDKQIFLDMLLDQYEKGEIDIDGIREEVDTFMFEGHDTTASGLSWTLYCLGRNLDVQKKLQAEIDENEDTGDLNKIKSLKYLECVIKEGLRLHPPVTFYARDLQRDTMIEGKVIPKGTMIIIDTFSLHTNPQYWDEPLVFKPERFLTDGFSKRNPYCYVPFSAGPRNCVGQRFAMLESKITIYHILRDFHIRSVQSEDEVESCFEIIHKSRNGLNIKLIPRH